MKGDSKQLYRRDLRVAVRFAVKAEVDGEPIAGCWAKDLSSGGMLLMCPRAPLMGSLLQLEFQVPGERTKFRIKGQVKRVTQTRLSMAQEPKHFVALLFVDMSDALQRGLRRLVMDQVMNLIETLREFPAFAKLSEFDLMALAGVCHRVTLAAEQCLVRQGDEATSLYFVRKGLVKLSGGEAEEESETAVELAGPGQIFGEVSTLTGLPHDLDITALEKTELVGLNRHGLYFLRENHPDTALRLMDIFVRFTGIRLRRLTRKLLTPLQMK